MAKPDRFLAGYLLAVANIMHLHGEEVIAKDVLQECGGDRADMVKCNFTEYDTDVLNPLFDLIERRPA